MIGIFVSVAGAIVSVVWMLGGWKGTVEERLKPLSGFDEWKGTVNAKLEHLTALLAEVRTLLTEADPRPEGARHRRTQKGQSSTVRSDQM